MIALFLLQGCDKENEQEPENLPANGSVMQVDIKVVIPVHPSSLNYFDYVISYTDNMGEENRDTIQESKGGITVEGWIVLEYESTRAKSRASQDPGIYCVKNFSYNTQQMITTNCINACKNVSYV